MAVEADLLFEGLYRRYGFDFRNYVRKKLVARLEAFLKCEDYLTVSALQERVLRDESLAQRLVSFLATSGQGLFERPDFFRVIREEAAPVLRTYPHTQIWNAGCGTGADAFSLAIVLAEEGVLERCRIYATDVSDEVTGRAASGRFDRSAIEAAEENYLASGGTGRLSRYFTIRKNEAVVRPALRKRILFAVHNLATDGGFNEFHLIVCRGVLGDFERPLQDRAHKLFFDSLRRFGMLGLGHAETIGELDFGRQYERLREETALYRKGVSATDVVGPNC